MDAPLLPAAQPSVGELLRSASDRLRAAGSETARLDAELLLGNVLHVDRASLLAHPEAQTGPAQRVAFEQAVARREAGEPVAYIRGTKEFYGLALMVDARALIPRPETELLVDLALARIREVLTRAPRAKDETYSVWDVGTGSGAVAVTLAVELRDRGYTEYLRIVATDVSADALALAVENAVGHGVADSIEFVSADLLAAPAIGRVDLVLANLPYVPSSAVPGLPVAARFEPQMALDGGPDGLLYIRRLIGELPEVLDPDGVAMLEIGSDQVEAVTAAATAIVPHRTIRIHADLGGQPRVLEIGPADAP